MSTYVMGDIHGAHKALVQCLERSSFNKEKDTLIQLGDVADGWPEVPQCVEELLSIKNLIAITGNHDDWAYEWFKLGMEKKIWLQQGGKATYDAYNALPTEIRQRHWETFWRKQVNYYVDEENRGFVHGGFSSRKGLGHEAHHSEYFWDRDLWNLVLMQDRHKDEYEHPNLVEGKISHGNRFLNHKEIYIGHTTTLNWNAKGNTKESKHPAQVLNGMITVPMQRCNVWNMDTGAGFKGKLTIMDIDTKEIFQSDKVDELYPDFQGR